MKSSFRTNWSNNLSARGRKVHLHYFSKKPKKEVFTICLSLLIKLNCRGHIAFARFGRPPGNWRCPPSSSTLGDSHWCGHWTDEVPNFKILSLISKVLFFIAQKELLTNNYTVKQVNNICFALSRKSLNSKCTSVFKNIKGYSCMWNEVVYPFLFRISCTYLKN